MSTKSSIYPNTQLPSDSSVTARIPARNSLSSVTARVPARNSLSSVSERIPARNSLSSVSERIPARNSLSSVSERIPARASFIAALLALILIAISLATLPSASAAEDSSAVAETKRLSAVNSIPFWAHDATGYHPSLCVRIENLSGADLTGKMIKLQCRFVDLRLGHVMIARKEQRYELAPNQGINLIFHGPEAYELPIDQYQWPLVECKLMSRIGDVDDSGTEDLLVQKLESVTMTDEEALQTLSRGFFQHAASSKRAHAKPARKEYTKPEEPLSARALSLSGNGSARALSASANGSAKSVPASSDVKPSLARFSSQPKIPGLGGEFLEFEQLYGHPVGASLKDKGWSWIRYTKVDPGMDVYIGAKGTSSRADLIVVKIPAEEVQQEAQVVGLAKAMGGKSRGQVLDHPHKTVKYQQLSEQRIRRILITTMDAPGYRLTFVNPRGTSADDNNYILILSRFTGDTVALIPELIRKAPMMRFLHSALGLPEQD
jgi:hypothetical protein